MKHGEIVSFLWDVANLIRDTFKRGKYQDVILPLTVLRRLDCVLAEKREAVLEAEAKYKDKPDKNKYSHPADAEQYMALGFAGGYVLQSADDFDEEYDDFEEIGIMGY